MISIVKSRFIVVVAMYNVGFLWGEAIGWRGNLKMFGSTYKYIQIYFVAKFVVRLSGFMVKERYLKWRKK